jgi:hypothetical protein
MAQLLTIERPYDEALRWIGESLKLAHLKVATSFDLRSVRTVDNDCSCAHHGTAACDCQMAVLLIYGADAQPATLLVHSSNGRTCISLTDFPGQRPSPPLRAAILGAFSLIRTPSQN